MPEGNYQFQRLGLSNCFNSFETVYCYRKLIEFLLSCIYIVATVVILWLYAKKHWLTKPYVLSSLLLILLFSLISNIFFCFYNADYWIYAVEVYFKNMYYLVLVSYICNKYLLKQTAEEREDLMQQLNINMNIPHSKPKNQQRIAFYIIIGLLSAGYFAILVASLVYQVRHEEEEKSDPDSGSSIKYCSETWYLILRVICILLSIIVVIAMVKIQKQQYKKILLFSHEQSRRLQSANNGIRHGSTDNSNSSEEKPLTAKAKVHNPFKHLWIWVGINVFSQVVNLIQSGFEISTQPPQCLIIPDDPNASNAFALIMIIITFFLGSGATLWYILYVKTLHNRTTLDRTVLYSDEYNVQGNIELYIPSRGQTATLSLPDEL